MPGASWSGFLRLSLVSCPIYLSPATTRTKSIRLHQVWRPAAANEPDADLPDRDQDKQVAHPSRPQVVDPGTARFSPRAREETPESRGIPCLFLNTERGSGGKPPKKSGFRQHLAGSKMPKEGSKMPKETFF